MATWIVLALIATGFLGWNLFRRFAADRIEALVEKRRSTSRLASRGEWVDGNRHIEVALAMTESTIFYENAEMKGYLDLQWVRGVEYDTRLATGPSVEGAKVLRLRCYSRTMEFVIPNDVVERWYMMLPPRRGMEPIVATPAIAVGLAPITP